MAKETDGRPLAAEEGELVRVADDMPVWKHANLTKCEQRNGNSIL